MTMALPLFYGLLALLPAIVYSHEHDQSTFLNPVFPGSNPDPSCIRVKEWDDTFFCATSTFNIFPGIPIHASKDLQNWKVISHALNRREQLPELETTDGSTSGLWAPTIRYHEGSFYLMTTLVHDNMTDENPDRWDNVVFRTKNPFDPSAWSDALHFKFLGYDTSPYWHEDGTVYVSGAHQWKVDPGIFQRTIDLETGEVGPEMRIWNGTGGMAPEAPHTYWKDGYYYLIVAEGGTGIGHMVTMARSKDINGPYESNPANPVLTNANTTEYFRTVGHADLFQDASGNWWSMALSTRSGGEYVVFPMGRETVMTTVTWEKDEWPVFEPVRGEMTGPLPRRHPKFDKEDRYPPPPQEVDFEPGSEIPDNFVYWRNPRDSYAVSEPGHPNTLALTPSDLNLTGHDGNYAPTGQTFIAVRQTDTLFTYNVNLDFKPEVEGEEAGVSVFLTMNHHIDLGIVNLPDQNRSSPSAGSLIPHFRFRAESYLPRPSPVVKPVPEAWRSKPLTLEIKAFNLTHYSFSAGPADSRYRMETVAYGAADLVSWGFTGTLIGVYATNNDQGGSTKAYFSKWSYAAQGQIRD